MIIKEIPEYCKQKKSQNVIPIEVHGDFDKRSFAEAYKNFIRHLDGDTEKTESIQSSADTPIISAK